MNLTEKNQVDPDILGLYRDEKAPYRVWDSTQIYFGGTATKGLYVPNIGDLIHHWIGDTLYEKRVVDVDESTLIPTLSDTKRPQTNENDLNQFRGVGPGYQSETWRVFYDDTKSPHTMMVDTNLKIYGTEAAYIKVFKGREIGVTGKVISQYRTDSRNAYSENVPLYVISDRFDASEAEKRIPVFYTTEHLERNEEVTVVVYTDGGQVGSVNHMRVVYGANIMELEHDQTYVLDIELISPFLSQTDDNLLEFPSNMPLDGVFTRAKVFYSNGEERILTIDGGRMKIIGLEYYIATKRNETNSLALRYQLGDNELAWGANTGENRHITKIYRYRTSQVEGSYNVMLNILPCWDATNQLYNLRYQLYNLERDISLDVTQFVEAGVNSDIFNGRKYGNTQHITVALQLEHLDIGLSQYRHAQQFDIALSSPADVSDRPYLILYHNDQAIQYGEFNQVKSKATLHDNQRHINFNDIIEAQDVDEWLERTYYAAQPLYDENIEEKAPRPTHFIVRDLSGNYEREFDLTQYDKDIIIPSTERNPIKNGTTLLVEFIRKQGRTTQYLNMTSWNVKV